VPEAQHSGPFCSGLDPSDLEAPGRPPDSTYRICSSMSTRQLAARLTRISGLKRAFFCNSGTEAWEGALKLTRSYARVQNSNGHKPKRRILALDNSFHGRTFGSLATTGQAKYRDPFAPLLPGVSFVGFNDTEDLRRYFDGSVCAICVETIQGEGGIHPISRQFLRSRNRRLLSNATRTVENRPHVRPGSSRGQADRDVL